MSYPDFINALPKLDIPFPESQVETRALRNDDALLIFFNFHEDTTLPPHSHGAQWGTLIAGEVTLTMNGETRTYRPGESWNIPAGVEHAVEIRAGSLVIDTFEEPDRYPLKR